MQKVRNPLSARHGPRRRLKSRAAMTLVEVMIAFTIMIAVLCGSLTAMQSGFKALDTARSATLAAQIMQCQVENLRLKNWTQLESFVGEKTFTKTELEALLPTSAQDAAGRFTLTQKIAPIAGRTGMMDVTLQVDWTGVGGIRHSRNFVTRYSQSGLYDYYITRR
jgi:type II secretory pathway pseudopilin PulG